MKKLVLRFTTGALALLITLTSFASTRSQYTCRMDGITHPSCCCGESGGSSPTGSTIGEACCCDVVTVVVSPQPSTVSKASLLLSSAMAFAVLLRVITSNPPGISRLPTAAVRPPIIGPPRILLKQSFLI